MSDICLVCLENIPNRINSQYCNCKNIPIHLECLDQVIKHNNIYCVYCNKKKEDTFFDYLLAIIDLVVIIFQYSPNVFTLVLVFLVLQLVFVLYIINIITNNENRFIIILLLLYFIL